MLKQTNSDVAFFNYHSVEDSATQKLRKRYTVLLNVFHLKKCADQPMNSSSVECRVRQIIVELTHLLDILSKTVVISRMAATRLQL